MAGEGNTGLNFDWAGRRFVRNWRVKSKAGKRDKWLLVIGTFKVVKAVLLLALAIGLTRLFHRDIAEEVERWIRQLNLDARNPFFQTFPSKIEGMTPGKLSMLCAGSFVYAGLFMTEGMGLLFHKRWAEYFTVIITGSFLPFEIYELAVKEFSVFKLVLLLVNVAVVVYLIWRLVHERKKG
jgi:uncharacterized membrane protein (DUF2068 family)